MSDDVVINGDQKAEGSRCPLCLASGSLREGNSVEVRDFSAFQHGDIRRQNPGGYTQFPDLANGPWPLQLTITLTWIELVLMDGYHTRLIIGYNLVLLLLFLLWISVAVLRS